MASEKSSNLPPGQSKNIANWSAFRRRYPPLPSARNPPRASPRRLLPPRREGLERGKGIVVKVGDSFFTLSRLQGLIESAHTNGKIPRRVVLPRDSLAAAAMVERWKDVIIETRQAELEAALKAITEAEKNAAAVRATAQDGVNDAPQTKRPFLWATVRTRSSSIWLPMETTTAPARLKKFLRKVPIRPVFERSARNVPAAPKMPMRKPVSEQPVCPPLFPESLANKTPTPQVTAHKTSTAKTLAVKGTNLTPAALTKATQVLDLVTPITSEPASKTTVDRAPAASKDRPSQENIKPPATKPYATERVTKKKPASQAPVQATSQQQYQLLGMPSLQVPAAWKTKKEMTPVNPLLANYNHISRDVPVSSQPYVRKTATDSSAQSLASTPPTRKTPSNSVVKPRTSTGSTPASKLRISKTS
ncbi:predicted protein [Verticillium alfalfae VaMs.102]|uniref:Predicted protein n=1 Tax=Verticillium alfalfae (strain VaMs.102 / ATCC MYA-4576 / FGSC 10136) TaxID=526221 RepID=C9SMW6_VERA1|nr:predicted protein [Verticillium alfalfae VaMs.102]EEY20131.1 predicted protein [Verticillium alfalfae VaMs.102]